MKDQDINELIEEVDLNELVKELKNAKFFATCRNCRSQKSPF